MGRSRNLVALLVIFILADARSQQVDPEFTRALTDAGKLFEDGNFAGVIEKLSPWAAKYPSDAEAQHGLGLAYYQQQDFAGTIRHLSAARQHEERNSDAWRQSTEILGMAFYFSRRWPDAVSLLATASTWSADNSTLFYSLGLSYLYNHDRDSARRTFSKLFGIPADTPGAAMLTADLAYQEMDGEDAEALYAVVLRKWPDFPEVQYKLGLIAVTKHDYAAVIEHMKAELAHNPAHALAWHYLGEALAKLEKPDEAASALQRAIWLNSLSVRSYITLGQVYSGQERFDLAESSLKHALTIEPQNYQANFLLGRLYYKTNRPELAKQQMAIAEKLRRPAADAK